MNKINWARVIGGGLLAGLVINVFEGVLNAVVLAEDWRQLMSQYNKPVAFSPGQIVTYNVLGFLMGIAAIWLYAAIRPRFGAGPRTALRAACAFWAFAYLFPNLFMVATDLVPARLVLTATVVGFVELAIAVSLGARLYREEAAATPAVRAAQAG